MFPVCPAATAPVAAGVPAGSGTEQWEASIQTPVRTMVYAWDFKLEGNKLTDTFVGSPFGVGEIFEGKINGDKITFVGMMDGSIRVEYKGKRAGEAIKFTRKVGDYGVEKFIAKRAK